MKGCHNLYLKILLYVSWTFRKESINYFELDPAHNLSTSAYSWHAIVRFTGTNLNLISDTKKDQFIEIMITVSTPMPYKGCAEILKIVQY